MNIHEKYINRCIQIGKNAAPSAYPNPNVGCCIVYKDCIIGEGFTSAYGGSHAEVNAINSVENKELLKASTLYVTLEPCSHFGKTPPCADLILKYKIPYIYIGIKDPNPRVSGNGIKRLEECGIKVMVGVLSKKCKELHKIFLTNIKEKRPYIVLKWAESSDSFIAPLKKKITKPVWLSNEYSRQLSHKLRTEFDCILVGSKTIISDNPMLNSRDWYGESPKIAVINKANDLDKNLNIFKTTSEVIIIDEKCIDFTQNIAKQICYYLISKGISRLLVEGGSQTLNTFIKEDLWDEIKVFKSPLEIKEGIKAPKINLQTKNKKEIIKDNLVTYLNN